MPVAATENVAVWPAMIAWLAGGVVIVGATVVEPVPVFAAMVTLQTDSVPIRGYIAQLFTLEVADCSERKT